MFVCNAPPPGRRPEHRIDRLTPIRPRMGRLLEHGVSANGLTRCMQHASPEQGRSVPTAEPSRCMTLRLHTHANGDDDDDDDRQRDDDRRCDSEGHWSGDAMSAGTRQSTRREGIWPGAVQVQVRPRRDDGLPVAVQAAAAPAQAAAAAVREMRPGAVMKKGGCHARERCIKFAK
jgi:hypothetical protein